MLGGTTNLIDLGKLAGDHVGHYMARVEADPDLKSGIAQAAYTPDQLDGRVAGQGGMVVVGDAIESNPSFQQLFMEYNKYLLRRAAVLVGI